MTPAEKAVAQLESALTEQARLGEAYERSVGTSAEQASYIRLQAATLSVSTRDRVVKNFRPLEGRLLDTT